jgi:hypothetical protein
MSEQYGKLEEGLLQAMKAIDNQVARAMQRTPAEKELQGVQKWEPYETRVEHIAAFILNELGAEAITLDAMIVLAQSFTKALRLVTHDLGGEGLGTVRASYCLDAMDKIERDAQRVKRELGLEEPM